MSQCHFHVCQFENNPRRCRIPHNDDIHTQRNLSQHAMEIFVAKLLCMSCMHSS